MSSIPPADACAPLRRVFLRDMLLSASIGVYPHEEHGRQPVRINIDLAVIDDAAATPGGVGPDELARVVDYEAIARMVRRIVAGGHVHLVETLAERLAGACLADPRVQSARVSVEKLNVFPDAAAAGVEVERRRG